MAYLIELGDTRGVIEDSILTVINLSDSKPKLPSVDNTIVMQ